MTNKEMLREYFSTVRIDHFEGTIGSLAQMISRKLGRHICPTEVLDYLIIGDLSEAYSIRLSIIEDVCYVEITKV